MKHIRRLTALLLCLLMAGTASSALAASKVFTAVPTLKITAPKGGVRSYDNKDITFNCSVPGFLTVQIVAPNGEVFDMLFDNQEVPSKSTVVDFLAVNEDQSPMEPGDYMLVGTLISQYGVPSKEVTTKLTIKPISEDDLEEYQMLVAEKQELAAQQAAAQQAAQQIAAVPESSAASADDSADDSASAAAPETSVASSNSSISSAISSAVSAPVAAPVVSGESVTYTAGITTMGDEGLQIGVGVTDTAQQNDAGYWNLTADSSDAEIWAALTREMVSVDVDEQESAYIYNSVKENRKKLGTVSGLSQGVNLIAERDDGWSLVEAFRKEDGAFVRGYIRSNKLRTVEPNGTYGLVIDKSTQTLIVYKDGVRLGSCQVSTGLPTPKYLHRETPAGEYIIVTRRGTTEYYGQGYSKYTMRISGTYYLSEIPTTRKNGSDFSMLSSSLGQKATRGNICIAHDPSFDGGINAEWIWNMSDANRKAKILIFDDKPRSSVPVGE